MKILYPLAFISILITSGCTGPLPKSLETPTSAATSATALVHSYHCKSGEKIAASYPTTDSATVQYKGINYPLHIAASGSGARYVGGNLEWWTKGSGRGSEGTLFRHKADGTSGELMELCTAS